jgi:hypothetical protein
MAVGDATDSQQHGTLLLRQASRCPPVLPPLCDGRRQKFSLWHALECKTGRLVVFSHNEIRDELSDLATKAFPLPRFVRNQPSIHHCCNLESKKAEATDDNPVQRLFCNNGNGEDRADMLI